MARRRHSDFLCLAAQLFPTTVYLEPALHDCEDWMCVSGAKKEEKDPIICLFFPSDTGTHKPHTHTHNNNKTVSCHKPSNRSSPASYIWSPGSCGIKLRPPTKSMLRQDGPDFVYMCVVCKSSIIREGSSLHRWSHSDVYYPAATHLRDPHPSRWQFTRQFLQSSIFFLHRKLKIFLPQKMNVWLNLKKELQNDEDDEKYKAWNEKSWKIWTENVWNFRPLPRIRMRQHFLYRRDALSNIWNIVEKNEIWKNPNVFKVIVGGKGMNRSWNGTSSRVKVRLHGTEHSLECAQPFDLQPEGLWSLESWEDNWAACVNCHGPKAKTLPSVIPVVKSRHVARPLSRREHWTGMVREHWTGMVREKRRQTAWEVSDFFSSSVWENAKRFHHHWLLQKRRPLFFMQHLPAAFKVSMPHTALFPA